MTTGIRKHARAAILLIGSLVSLTLSAHEVTPAYLEISAQQATGFDVLWKQPLRAGRRLKIEPQLPASCEKQHSQINVTGSTLLERWQIDCDLRSGALAVSGLDRTLTDVFVRINWSDGDTTTALLRAGNASIDLTIPTGTAASHYLWLGVEHILLGFDHLLFVLGLMLLVAKRQLLITITAFTVAHSITLALSAIAGIRLPGAPVEIVIALSIVLLALEALRQNRGGSPLASRYPWAIAFSFGLLHGFGFAGALRQIGLPAGDELLALGLFNLGVELGQIAFIIAALAAAWLLLKTRLLNSSQGVTVMAYGIGIAGCYWVIERTVEVIVAGV